MASDQVSNEDVAKKQEELSKLRQEVADLEAQRLSDEQASVNAIVMAQLEAEEARLKSDLVIAKQSAKDAGTDSAESPLANARAAAAQAQEQEEARAQAVKDKAEVDAEQAKLAAKAVENPEGK